MQTAADTESEKKDLGVAAGAAPLMAGQAANLLNALKEAAQFVVKASGTALGIALSGSNHPNPDRVLLDLATEGNTLSASLRAAIAKAEGRSS